MLHALFEVYRRTLWLLTVVLALSVVTFALAPAPTVSTHLPRFINSKPKRLNQYAWALAQNVAAADLSSKASAAELQRLGAVALPHVLPKLDSLPPDGRLRVLAALDPVALRMGLSHSTTNTAQLSGTWLTFLSDNVVYLNPAMAKRQVERFVADPSAQHIRDLRRLDTFALGELVRALFAAELSRNRERSFQIVEVLRQITGHDSAWSLPPLNDVDEATSQSVLERWKTWWFAERHLYDPPTATSHLTSPLLQTQFALWVRSGAGAWMDRGVGELIRAIPWGALTRSVCLFLIAVFGGNALARAWRPGRTQRRIVSLLGLATANLGWLPPSLLAVWAHEGGLRGVWIAAPMVVLFGAALSLRPERASPEKKTVPGLPGGSTYTATLLCVCLVVEWGFQIEGLGPIVVQAVKSADAIPVLCVSLVNTLLIGIIQYLSPRLTDQRAQHGAS
jgi:hypothetical protein